MTMTMMVAYFFHGWNDRVNADGADFRRQQMRAQFEECDVDNNGFVSLDEAKTVLQKPPFNFADEKVHEIIINVQFGSCVRWSAFFTHAHFLLHLIAERNCVLA